MAAKPKRDLHGLAIPRHVAIIMDGNGRWARKRGLPRNAGHRAGVQAARRVVEACAEMGVGTLTVFAFSSENWSRPEKEVRLLMTLFIEALQREAKELHKNGVKLEFVGDRAALSDKLQKKISEAEALTRDNTVLRLVVAVSYGGRWDIVQAARKLAAAATAGDIEVEDIDEEAFAWRLALSSVPDPDLFIRTGDELRISNFLLWNLAYTEMYFSDRLWPDFDGDALEEAIRAYSRRQRRFGRTGEQVGQA